MILSFYDCLRSILGLQIQIHFFRLRGRSAIMVVSIAIDRVVERAEKVDCIGSFVPPLIAIISFTIR